MDVEIEAKFTKVNHDTLREKLKNIGGTCERPLTLMKRVVYHPNDDSLDAYFRVRDEGDRVTMTYKQFDDASSIHGVKEIETVVGDYDATVAILDRTGMSRETYQETRREVWRLDDVEIMLDEWPWVEPFVEIEGPTEEAVRAVSEKFGFDWSMAVYGGVASVYVEKYKNMGKDAHVIINRRTPVIRFEDPVPENFR